jgi:hypothetical protein
MTSPDASVTIEIRRETDPPFDDPEADVIIRSSNNIDFYVFKTLLSFSSSVFKDMFYVAQGKPEDDELKDGLQVIPTSDSAETWRILFRFLYPCGAAGQSTLNSLDEFSRAIEASRKYGITRAEEMIIAELIAPRFSKANPMRIYALACQYGLEAEAREAAKQTLCIPILGRPYVVELENMAASHYHRLQEYHQCCGIVASEVAANTEWIQPSSFVGFSSHDVCGKEGRKATLADGNIRRVATWWADYMMFAETALEDCPVGATVVASDLMCDVLRNANRCPYCSCQAYDEMRAFGAMFAAEVDRVVAKVSRICLRSS